MSKSKRFWGICGILAALLLSGCGGAGEQNTAANTQTDEPDTA